jgi:hypothetical protein
MDPITLGGIFSLGTKLIDKLFPDPTQRAQAQLELLRMEQDGDLAAMKVQLSAILAEAQSADPWTSRARPTFLYMFYVIVMFLVIAAPLIGVFFPSQMAQFFTNVTLGFAAIPEALWWTFTTGYLGYTASRQYGKTKGTDK